MAIDKRIILVPVEVHFLDNEPATIVHPTVQDVKDSYSVLNAFSSKEQANTVVQDALSYYEEKVGDEKESLPEKVTISYNGKDHTYTNESYIRFVMQAEEEGWHVRHYCGRNFYEGPAVVVTRDEVRYMQSRHFYRDWETE